MVRILLATASRLLHYWWPVLVGWSVSEVVAHATGLPPSLAGRGVLLLAIWAAYSYDRVVDPSPQRHSRLLDAILWTGFTLAVVGTCVLLQSLPVGTLLLLAVLAAISLAYRRLKAFPMVKTILVPVVWTWAGVALPLADGSWFGWRVLLQPVSAPLFLLLISGCLLCDLKDLTWDRARGIQSLPAQVGVPWTMVLAGSIAAAGTILALFLGRSALAVAGLLLLLLAGCRPLLTRALWGPLAVDLALTVPGFLILFRLV